MSVTIPLRNGIINTIGLGMTAYPGDVTLWFIGPNAEGFAPFGTTADPPNAFSTPLPADRFAPYSSDPDAITNAHTHGYSVDFSILTVPPPDTLRDGAFSVSVTAPDYAVTDPASPLYSFGVWLYWQRIHPDEPTDYIIGYDYHNLGPHDPDYYARSYGPLGDGATFAWSGTDQQTVTLSQIQGRGDGVQTSVSVATRWGDGGVDANAEAEAEDLTLPDYNFTSTHADIDYTPPLVRALVRPYSDTGAPDGSPVYLRLRDGLGRVDDRPESALGAGLFTDLPAYCFSPSPRVAIVAGEDAVPGLTPTDAAVQEEQYFSIAEHDPGYAYFAVSYVSPEAEGETWSFDASGSFGRTGKVVSFEWRLPPTFAHPEGLLLGTEPIFETDFSPWVPGTLFIFLAGMMILWLFVTDDLGMRVGARLYVPVPLTTARYGAALDPHATLYRSRKSATPNIVEIWAQWNPDDPGSAELRSVLPGTGGVLFHDRTHLYALIKDTTAWLLRKSMDCGDTWSEPLATPFDNATYGSFVSIGRIGTVLVAAGINKSTGAVLAARSFDDGAHWESPVAVGTAESSGRTINVLPGDVAGSNAVRILTTGHQWVSYDTGATWSGS